MNNNQWYLDSIANMTDEQILAEREALTLSLDERGDDGYRKEALWYANCEIAKRGG